MSHNTGNPIDDMKQDSRYGDSQPAVFAFFSPRSVQSVNRDTFAYAMKAPASSLKTATGKKASTPRLKTVFVNGKITINTSRKSIKNRINKSLKNPL